MAAFGISELMTLPGDALARDDSVPVGRPTDTLRLEDGRLLGFGEFGDPSGFPILAFHGIPGSRLTFAFADGSASRHGLRLITLERPGIGLSTALPRRSILDWTEDVRQAADRLRLGSFGVIGLSGGGPYALAVAHRLPARVRGTAIVSGMGPVDDPWVLDRSTWRQRFRLHLFRDLPGFAPLLVAVAGLGLKHLRDHHLMRFLRAIPEPGREVLEEERFAPFIFDPLREGYRQGSAGVGLDLRLMTRPWGFRIEEVRGPVVLWHGEDDFDVPSLLARAVARRLPCCDPHFIPEAGHLWILGHVEQVLGKLAQLLET